jgi:phosphatidylserine decarboxylase
VGLAFVVLAGFFLFFFRDPHRVVTPGIAAVLAPADGRVMVAGAPTGEASPPGDWQQITIFLSPMDVHVNRMPVGGRVLKVRYHPGRFLPAYRSDAGDLNEHTEVWLDHGGQTIVVRQIVGILARRIVCRAREGDVIEAGQRFGVMKFGSRMDVFVPVSATITAKVGDRVVGAVSVIAELKP